MTYELKITTLIAMSALRREYTGNLSEALHLGLGASASGFWAERVQSVNDAEIALRGLIGEGK